MIVTQLVWLQVNTAARCLNQEETGMPLHTHDTQRPPPHQWYTAVSASMTYTFVRIQGENVTGSGNGSLAQLI